MALENQQYDLASFLITKGADPNVASFSGICPLHLAAQAGNTALVRELIKKGANIYAKTSDSETAKELASNDEVFGQFSVVFPSLCVIITGYIKLE